MALTYCRHLRRSGLTPADFERAGLTLDIARDPSPPSEASEYWQRIRAGLPTRAPAFSVGDWVYNPIAKENHRILSVHWDSPVSGLRGGWRYGQAGYSTLDPSFGPHEGAPFVEHITDNGWSYRPVYPAQLCKPELTP